MSNRNYLQGYFKPKNPEKYKGDPNKIVYRSSWELKLFHYLDLKDDVIEWESEEFFIPYHDPFRGKTRRYFPDVRLKVKTADGKVETHVWEVKPKKQTVEPKKPKRKTKNYIYEKALYDINKKKWAAAEEYCSNNGFHFKLITEDELKIK